MEITLIGAGNLATNLGHALKGAGHTIRLVWSRTEASARALGEKLGCEWTTLLSEAQDGGLFFISVKDSVLQEIAAQLPPDAFVVHTAGSMPMDILPQPRRGVLYPMQTFSRERLVFFRDIPIFIEAANANDLQLLQTLAESLSPNVQVLSSNRRCFLHVAAVFACNFVNHCYQLSAEILAEHDIPFSAMLPLIGETARKVHTLPPHAAQTGPAVRWDENVMQRHLQMLDEEKRHIYELMSKSIHGRS